MDDQLFLCSKNEYKDFLKTIKKGCIEVKEQNINGDKVYNVISKKTNKTLCARKINEHEEQYYIFDTPDVDETQPLTFTKKYEVTTPQAFQKILDYLREKNVRNI